MELTKRQFLIMEAFALAEGNLTQRDVEGRTGLSLGTVNKTVKELTGLGLVSKGKITAAGLESMEPYRAKRAVFVAAGFGSRLVPITLNTPKPLVRVHGHRIIDTLIDACLEAGIDEIYIVRGYLAEQFDQLLYKYPMIRFLENPLYNEANNISSALVARYLLSNAYVFEADLLLSNAKIIRKYHYTSEFLAIYKERTDDWCFEVRDGVIVREKVGGTNCWQMVGISYWNEQDGHKLAQDIVDVYGEPGGKERYWEQVPLTYRSGHYTVRVRECRDEDIVEIDTFRELKAIDKSYDV
ncbi:MAG: NTP transferase domain-containing protein [Oscillospiraceae bacterium]|nr:NTP transferase domain-containing protein [Oscillospiraceae bacterium]